MTFAEAQNKPNASNIFLARVTAFYNLDGWVVESGTTYQHPLTIRPIGVRWEPGTDLTEAANLAACNATASRWYWSKADGLLYVNPPAGATETIFDAPVQAEILFLFANRARLFDDGFAEDRIKTVPKLSLRIEERFGGVAQTGGGSMVFNNADGFFDDLAGKVQWNAGTVALEMGIDAAGSVMAEADYRLLATWQIEDSQIDDMGFTLELKERKNNLRRKLPLNKFTRAGYPGIADSLIGKVIPIGWGRVFGAPAILLDLGARQFKVADHAIKEFISVRVQRRRDQEEEVEPDSDSWSLFSGSIYRLQTSREVIRVEFNGTELDGADSVAGVTANKWYRTDGYLYINVSAAPSSGTVNVVYRNESTFWETVNFETKDIANGEFTLPAALWSGSEAVSVDFDAGDEINPADIVADVLATIEETNIDSASFSAAREYYLLGTDRFGREVHLMKPSVYLTEEKEALEILSTINQAVGAFLYAGADGAWFFKAFEPQPSDGLTVFEDGDLLDMEQEARVDNLVSKVTVSYAERIADKWSQTATAEDTKAQRRNNAALPIEREVKAALWDSPDAEYLAQRILTTEGDSLRIFTTKISRQAFSLVPGEQIVVRYSRRQGLRSVFEVLEVDHDLAGNGVNLKLGNLRGWEVSSGYWVSDSVVDWDGAGTADEKKDAAAASGFWTDDNGFADTSDALSRGVSRWW